MVSIPTHGSMLPPPALFPLAHSVSPCAHTEDIDAIVYPKTKVIVVPRVNEQTALLALASALIVGLCMAFNGKSHSDYVVTDLVFLGNLTEEPRFDPPACGLMGKTIIFES